MARRTMDLSGLTAKTAPPPTTPQPHRSPPPPPGPTRQTPSAPPGSPVPPGSRSVSGDRPGPTPAPTPTGTPPDRTEPDIQDAQDRSDRSDRSSTRTKPSKNQVRSSQGSTRTTRTTRTASQPSEGSARRRISLLLPAQTVTDLRAYVHRDGLYINDTVRAAWDTHIDDVVAADRTGPRRRGRVMQPLSLWYPPEVIDEFRARAERTHRSVSVLISECVDRYLSSRPVTSTG